MTHRALVLALLVGAVPACKQRTANKAPAPTAAPAQAQVGGGNGGGNGKSARDPSVYVDGELRASLTYNELPATVKLLEHRGDAGDAPTHRMLVCDYFRALGVDCATIKETHWYAGKRRIAIISGAELRRFRNSLAFDFAKDLSGKPRLDWESAPALQTTVRPDLVNDVCIYVKEKAPKWDSEKSLLVDEAGEAIVGIPYSHDDGKKGVRINVDGRLVTKIKRNLLEGNVEPVAEPKAGEEPRYRLADFLKATNVALAGVRGIDLLVRDERVLRLSKEEVAAGVEFTAARQHHGEMMFYFAGNAVPALAVDIWSKSDAPTRPMHTVTVAELAAPTPGAVHGRR